VAIMATIARMRVTAIRHGFQGIRRVQIDVDSGALCEARRQQASRLLRTKEAINCDWTKINMITGYSVEN
jgi:hypothetical protein